MATHVALLTSDSPTMSNLEHLLDILKSDPDAFYNLSVSKILRFVSYTSLLKRDILLAQPANQSEATPPDCLPPTIEHFLSSSCSISQELTKKCWDVFKEIMWGEADDAKTRQEMDFQLHGHLLGLST
jgi:hypothetical protein